MKLKETSVNDLMKKHGGKPGKRERAPLPTLAERKTRGEQAAAEGAIAMAEHEERVKVKRANMGAAQGRAAGT